MYIYLYVYSEESVIAKEATDAIGARYRDSANKLYEWMIKKVNTEYVHAFAC